MPLAADVTTLTMGAYLACLLTGAEWAQTVERLLRDAQAAHADQLAQVRRERATQVAQLRRQL